MHPTLVAAGASFTLTLTLSLREREKQPHRGRYPSGRSLATDTGCSGELEAVVIISESVAGQERKVVVLE